MEKVRRSGAAEMGQLRNTGNPNDRLFWLNIFLENCAMCACGSKIQCKGKSRLDNSLQFFFTNFHILFLYITIKNNVANTHCNF